METAARGRAPEISSRKEIVIETHANRHLQRVVWGVNYGNHLKDTMEV